MSVYKRNGHWHFTKTINGVRYRGAFKTARTKAQAEEAYLQVLTQIHEGTYGTGRRSKTLRDFVEQIYIPWAKNNKRSWKSDQSMLKPILEYLGKKPLSQISPFDVERYKVKRRDSVTVRKQPRSKSSVNHELKLLSRIFQLAKLQKQVRVNPCSEVARLKGEIKRKRYLLPEEQERLMAALTGKREHLRSIVIIDLNTGLRRGELFSLKLEDLDFNRDVIHIRESKTDRDREVPMNATARTLLLELADQARLAGWQYIFTNPTTGKPYHDLKRAFTGALRDAGIVDFHFHDLRHTFGTRAVDNGAPLTGVRDALGHASLSTTNRYAHGTEEGKRRAVEAQERVRAIAGHNSVTNEKRQAS
jgi:integrase